MKTTAIRLVLCAILLIAARLAFYATRGVFTLLCFAAMLVCGVLCLKFLVELYRAMRKKPRPARAFSILALLLTSLSLPVLAFEGILELAAKQKGVPLHGDGSQPLTLPNDWKQRDAHVDGAAQAFYWHGKLHVFNKERMRIAGHFPAKRDDTFRVIVLGDSLTYGMGVAEEETYSGVLQRELSKNYRAEVLNLGVNGYSSEDVLAVLKAKLPLLQPDLVVYGMCHNDFLPSGALEYHHMNWEITFPGQRQLLTRTEIGPFLQQKYDGFLVQSGIRDDFFRDILRDFDGKRKRFAQDVKEMNACALAAGLPPVIALVLDQYPERARADLLTGAAEEYLTQAGMNVIPATYRREKHGAAWNVSRWEGHPNATAHAIFARELLPAIERTPALQKYRKDQ